MLQLYFRCYMRLKDIIMRHVVSLSIQFAMYVDTQNTSLHYIFQKITLSTSVLYDTNYGTTHIEMFKQSLTVTDQNTPSHAPTLQEIYLTVWQCLFHRSILSTSHLSRIIEFVAKNYDYLFLHHGFVYPFCYYQTVISYINSMY